MVEEAGGPAFNEATRAEFKTVCGQFMARWAAGSAEDQAMWEANVKKMTEGWEKDPDGLTAELSATFAAAATNENKLLNEAQFVDM